MKLLFFSLLVTGVSANFITGRCSSDSCASGADCTQVKQDVFICHCDSHHYGIRCEHKRCEKGDSDPSCGNISNCTGSNCPSEDICGRDQPCLNRGICTNTDSGFNCSCPEGFFGERCESEPIHCQPESCVNGYCIDYDHESKCVCDQGWTGDRCHVDIDECFHSPCAPNSFCLNKNGSFECICPEGQTGPRCQFETGPCSSDRECLNGGRCIENSCICTEEFDGPNCEMKFIDPCNQDSCWDNHVCVRNRTEILGFSCVCPPGLTGRFCGTPIDIQSNKVDLSHHTESSSVSQKSDTVTDITLVLLVKPSVFIQRVDDFLSSLSQRLRTSVKIKKTLGEMDVFEWNSITGEGERIKFGSRTDARVEYLNRAKRTTEENLNGVLVVIQVDLADCSRKCFGDANAVVMFIESSEARQHVDSEMPIHEARRMDSTPNETNNGTQISLLVVVAVVAIALVLIGMISIGVKRRMIVEAPIWNPPCKEAVRESTNNYYSSHILGLSTGYSSYHNISADSSKLPTPVYKNPPMRIEMPANSKLELAAIGDERITPEMKCLVGQSSRFERTALHWLALNSTKSSSDILSDCNLLISFGIDVNAQDMDGNTALHYACRNARFPLIQPLLDAGANPTIDNELDMTALHEAAKHFDDRAIEIIISHKIYKDTTKFDLVDMEDRTALMLYTANSCNSIKGIEMMIKAGADINFAGDKKRSYRFKGKTALHHAAQFNTDNKKMIEFLISKNSNKDAQDCEEATPLWLAVNSNNYLAVDELLKAGASLDFADQKERTPEVLAMEKGYTRVSERLRIARLKCPTIGMLPSSFNIFNHRSTLIPPPRIIKKPTLKKLTPATPTSEETTPSPPGLKASLSSGPSCLDSPHSDRLSANSSSEIGSPGYTPVYTLNQQPQQLQQLQQLQQAPPLHSTMRPSPPYDQDSAHFSGMQLPPLTLHEPSDFPFSSDPYNPFPSFPPPFQPRACAYQNE